MSVPNDANATGRSFGPDEQRRLAEVLDRGVLISQYGTVVPELEEAFRTWVGAGHCVAVASGTAALHCAIASVGAAPGDEVITSPITDMGAVMPIVYEGCVPVFADVDPTTCNVTADAVEARVTERTRAIIVTHLFGLAADLDSIMEVARRHELVVIEDAAQAYGAAYKGKRVGTIGHVGCYSLQQGKHITCGEGGFVLTDDPERARFLRLYHDKGWGFGDDVADHELLGLNYRMTELQAAVAMAQFGHLDDFVERRRRLAARLSDALAGIDGLRVPGDYAHGTHAYWRYPLRVEEPLGDDTLNAMSSALREIGARTAPRYTVKLAFEYGFLQERERLFGGSGFPFVGPQRDGAAPLDYDRASYPGAVAGLARLLCIGWNERYDEAVVDRIAETIRGQL